MRISVAAPKYLQDLADDIEHGFYKRGYEADLIEEILKLDPNASIIRGNNERLHNQLAELRREKFGEE